MDIKPYFFGLEPAEREVFAANCGTTRGHIQNIAYGFRKATAELAAQFERNSQGRVTVEETLASHHWIRVKDESWPHADGRPLYDVAAPIAEAKAA
ncbi:hypothetical protein [Variovorax paradoxus]|uniref:hypothetical protein n=1 Tax=Variovorax paradoxus TaxID=34073 RepID=UPI00193356D0|nr:hypothetical protein INQ48_20590 [Variovorax paradoxus]